MIKAIVLICNLNTSRRMELTLDSLRCQGRYCPDIWVFDGGSDDGVEEVIGKNSDIISRYVQRRDKGLYDCLAKGLSEIEDAELVCYINCGDTYCLNAWKRIREEFEDERVMWITGLPSHSNEDGTIKRVHRPFRYTREWIVRGFYNGKIMRTIQQESCVWRASLIASVDLNTLASFSLAGDFFMWHSFAKAGYKPKLVSAVLASFMHHEKQLSEDRGRYMYELENVIRGYRDLRGIGRAYLTGIIERYAQIPDLVYQHLCKEK